MSELELFCPYKGLQPYTEDDRDYFFGREDDRETISANLATAPLTIIYGASGVGKTSVLLAGVVPYMRALPNVIVIVFRTWQDRAFLTAIKNEIASVVAEHLGSTPIDMNLPFDEFLAHSARATRSTLAIILDQFEDYFLYHPETGNENNFDAEFASAVNRDDVGVHFLLSIREDSLSAIDRFQGRIPNLFSNYLRIEHLDLEAARAAVEKPVAQYNRLLAGDQLISIEVGLTDTVLQQVKTGQVILGQIGRGVIASEANVTKIETPYLQLVMTRLWNEDIKNGVKTLRMETLNRLGGAEQIVKTHLDATMNALSPREKDMAAQVFHYLVTPSGAKIAHSVSDLVEYVELPKYQLDPVLKKLSLSDIRILRPITTLSKQPSALRYEIFHDVLASAILDWRARHEQPKLFRRLALISGVVSGIVFLGLLVILHIGIFWGFEETTLSTDDMTKLSIHLIQVALAVVIQGCAAIIITGNVRRLSRLNGIYAAFIATCIMSAGILGIKLLSDRKLTFEYIATTIVPIIFFSIVLTLFSTSKVTRLIALIRRFRFKTDKTLVMIELKKIKVKLPFKSFIWAFWLASSITIFIISFMLKMIETTFSYSTDQILTVFSFIIFFSSLAIGGLIIGVALRATEPYLQWKHTIIITLAWVISVFIGLVIGAIIWGVIGLLVGDDAIKIIGGVIGGFIIHLTIAIGVTRWQYKRALRRAYSAT
jgi:hypothetical protein